MKRGKKMALGVLTVIILLISGIIVWFKMPYSPAKSEFERLAGHQIQKSQKPSGVFTPDDISGLPAPVQKYFQYCGYIGTPKMANMRIYHEDVDFVLSPDQPKLKIKYIQYNSVNEPERIAFIDTSMHGIPFEGIDAYQNGQGSMKGVIAKAYTLFDQKGKAMDSASLVTCLSESLLVPNFALQDFITWEAIDDTHAKATIRFYGISTSGIFTFDDNGAMTRFTTDDREYTDMKGNTRKVKWSAICENYRAVNGIKQPKTLKAVWHFETGDLIYFEGRNTVIEYNVEQ